MIIKMLIHLFWCGVCGSLNNWGTNIGWGCSRIWCWRRYLGPRGTW